MSDDLSVGPVGDLPDAWVEVIARELWNAADDETSYDWRDHMVAAHVVLTDLLPLIRAHIADEIQAIPRRTDFQLGTRDAHNAALAMAAREVRGDTDA